MVRRQVALVLCLAAAVGPGCKKNEIVEPITPDYARQLRPGESALRLITDPARMPDLAKAHDGYHSYHKFLIDAIEQSLTWFEAPSGRQFFPFDADGVEITHDLAKASVLAFRDLVESAATGDDFHAEIVSRFNVFESVGYNGEGTVLYTGYYSPVFSASYEQTGEYQFPLYRRPTDLVTDAVTGEPRGRQTESGVVPYATRREIEETGMFAGNELVWLPDQLSAYIIHVNGSARLRMTDGTTLYIGYAGKTDRPYQGLGKSMVDEGLIKPENLSLPAIKNYFRRDPDKVVELIYRNENYVFFTEYDESIWPAGSLGVRVTEETTLATDKKIYPRGGVVLVDTDAVSLSYTKRPFLHFMLDQDTGGAIQAPGRADIFMGTGEMAEILAGGQYAEGRLYYFFLKPEELGLVQ